MTENRAEMAGEWWRLLGERITNDYIIRGFVEIQPYEFKIHTSNSIGFWKFINFFFGTLRIETQGWKIN
jgi:hypothetical protein